MNGLDCLSSQQLESDNMDPRLTPLLTTEPSKLVKIFCDKKLRDEYSLTSERIIDLTNAIFAAPIKFSRSTLRSDIVKSLTHFGLTKKEISKLAKMIFFSAQQNNIDISIYFSQIKIHLRDKEIKDILLDGSEDFFLKYAESLIETLKDKKNFFKSTVKSTVVDIRVNDKKKKMLENIFKSLESKAFLKLELKVLT